MRNLKRALSLALSAAMLVGMMIVGTGASYADVTSEHNTEAIVMNLVAPVKSSPSAGSKDIFVLHEGTRVRMLEQLDGWTEIVLSDGNKGWITSNAIEAIVKTDDGGVR